MYEYLCNDTPQSPAVLLASYERKEMLSLLELALWKSSVLNGEMFRDIQEIREYPVLDEEFDVRRYFDQARVTRSFLRSFYNCTYSYVRLF